MARHAVRKMNKKGQLKILESVAVLVVFFFLVGLGIKFYGNMQLQALQEAKDDFARSDSIKISQKVVHMPELRCTLVNTDQGSCVDLYNALAWKDTVDPSGEAKLDNCVTEVGAGAGDAQSLCSERLNHYFEQIGVGEIVLRRTYTADTSQNPGDLDWTLYNYSTESSLAPDVKSTSTWVPVVIYDRQNDRRDLGVLIVKVYS